MLVVILPLQGLGYLSIPLSFILYHEDSRFRQPSDVLVTNYIILVSSCSYLLVLRLLPRNYFTVLGNELKVRNQSKVCVLIDRFFFPTRDPLCLDVVMFIHDIFKVVQERGLLDTRK